MSEPMKPNRKIVHDIKGKLSPVLTLAQLEAKDEEQSEEMKGLMKQMAKQSVVIIPQIIELLDKIE